MSAPGPSFVAFGPRGPLTGTARLPGDKSISHRALILAALAVGESRITGLNDGADVAATARALAALGARIDRQGADRVMVRGIGLGSLLQPESLIDCGNSGTTARLVMGLIASHRIRAALAGDSSLRRRPMARLTEPLRRLGASLDAGRLPIAMAGALPATPLTHRLSVPSAQVRSALLLAGLNTPGVTTVVSPAATRDHLERLLPLFGAELELDGLAARIRGEPELRPCDLSIPGDASAAAFLAAAAAIVPGSSITLADCGMNPGRSDWIAALQEMGAPIERSNERSFGNEPLADLTVRHAPLKAIDIAPERVPGLIDELAVLAIAAACASGTSRFRGLGELRHKESDRLAALAHGLAAVGVRAVVEHDDLIVHGVGEQPLSGGEVATLGDHRIAMAFAVAGLRAAAPLRVAGMASAAVSFPAFMDALDALTAL